MELSNIIVENITENFEIYNFKFKPKDIDLYETDSANIEELNKKLKSYIRVSEKTIVIRSEMEIYAIGGIRKIKDRIGVPWAITSDIDFKIIKQFIKTSREFMLDLQKKYDVLYNYTSDSNIKSHKWLKSLGFEIKYDKTFTADTGKRFIYFEWRKKYV